MLKKISSVTEAHTIQCLSTLKVNCDSVKRFKYVESQQHSIKNNTADTVTINISDTVNYAFINL